MFKLVLDGELSIAVFDAEAQIQIPMESDPPEIITIDGDPQILNVKDGDVQLVTEVGAEFGVVTKVNEGAYPIYSGPVSVIPSRQAQVLPTVNKSVLQNIVVQPIPQNYGLITWNGTVLTVS